MVAKTLLQFAVVIVIFLILTVLGQFIHTKLKNRYGKSIDMNKLLPEEEVHTLKQVFYLILMALCIVNIFYSITGSELDVVYFIIFDVALSLYFAILLDKSSIKNKIIWLLLVPYRS